MHIVQLALNGASLRSLERATGTSINTITNWLLILGEGAQILNNRVHNFEGECIEFDEQWGWVGVKTENKQAHHPVDFGDRSTYLAVDKKSWLIVIPSTRMALR